MNPNAKSFNPSPSKQHEAGGSQPFKPSANGINIHAKPFVPSFAVSTTTTKSGPASSSPVVLEAGAGVSPPSTNPLNSGNMNLSSPIVTAEEQNKCSDKPLDMGDASPLSATSSVSAGKGPRGVSSDDVAASYDRVTALHTDKTKEIERVPYRYFNNFIKKKLISYAIQQAVDRPPKLVANNTTVVPATTESSTADAPKKWVPKRMRLEEGKSAPATPQVVPTSGLMVLDIACGRGGDIGKWIYAQNLLAGSPTFGEVPSSAARDIIKRKNFPNDCEIKTSSIAAYLGADVSRECIVEARSRASVLLNPVPTSKQKSASRATPSQLTTEIQLHVADCWTQQFWEQELQSQLIQKTSKTTQEQIQRQGGFDIISVQFALHYACQSLEALRQVLTYVSAALRVGGVFIGTVVDASELSRRISRLQTSTPLLEKPQQQQQPSENITSPSVSSPALTNGLFSVRPCEDVSFLSPTSAPNGAVTQQDRSLPIGFMYEFFLEGHVECAEYVIPWPAFVSEAEKVGLVLESALHSERTVASESPPHVHSPQEQIDGGNYNFASVISEYECDPKVRSQLDERWLSADERELVSLYRTFCFIKKK